jgi:phosphopantothenate synthetase
MKAFIEKVFKMKKQKQKEILDEIIHSEDTKEVTEVAVKTIKPSKKQAEVEVQHTDTKDD